jgi:hypothetical protein
MLFGWSFINNRRVYYCGKFKARYNWSSLIKTWPNRLACPHRLSKLIITRLTFRYVQKFSGHWSWQIKNNINDIIVQLLWLDRVAKVIKNQAVISSAKIVSIQIAKFIGLAFQENIKLVIFKDNLSFQISNRKRIED